MKIVHNMINSKLIVTKPTKVSAQEVRATAWMNRQYRKQHEDACLEFADRIKKIQSVFPDFKP